MGKLVALYNNKDPINYYGYYLNAATMKIDKNRSINI